MKKLIPAFIYLLLRLTAIIFAARSFGFTEQVFASSLPDTGSAEIIPVSDSNDIKGSCKRGRSCYSPGCRDWVDHDCDGHCDKGL